VADQPFADGAVTVGLLAVVADHEPALALGQSGLLLYALAVSGAMTAFAHGHEEPALVRQFGAQYEAYRRAVPAWSRRRHPWQPDQADQPARHET
jgi:protein-S-isoprenylcysteine O-methyltransferase Ste14